MVAFGHTAVGAATGLLVYQALSQTHPALGVVAASSAGIISHYITDFIPHGHFIKMSDYKSKIIPIIIFDLLGGIIIFLAAAFFTNHPGSRFLYILFGIGGAQLPDALDGLIYMAWLPKTGFFKYENNFHQWLHWHGRGDKSLMLGFLDVWQFLVVIISLYLVIVE